MLKSFGVLCCGDTGGVVIAREFTVVAVGEVDRRVLFVDVGTESCTHNLCLGWPSSQTFHSNEQMMLSTLKVVTENK